MRLPLTNCQFNTAAARILFSVCSLFWGEASAQCLRYSVDVVPGPPCTLGTASVATGLNSAGEICGHWFACGIAGNVAIWPGFGDWLTFLLPSNVLGAGFADINLSRHIAGTIAPVSSPELYRAAFFDFPDGAVTNLGVLPGHDFSVGHAINENDVVCGLSMNTVNGPLQAFTWQGGLMSGLKLPMGPNSEAYDISDNGFVCGWMGDSPHTGAHGFIWSNTGTIDLGTVLPGAIGADVRGISDNGTSVCGLAIFKDRARAFVWDNSGATDLGVLPGYLHSHAYAVNASKIVVGYCNDPPGAPSIARAFVWQDGVMMDLNLLIPLESNLHIEVVYAINTAGQIAGGARMVIAPPVYGDDVAVRLTPIPPKTGDVNCDWIVNIDDLVGVITRWNDHGGPADLNADGVVNLPDLVLVLTHWNS